VSVGCSTNGGCIGDSVTTGAVVWKRGKGSPGAGWKKGGRPTG
jgi:hypothetical protein